MTGILGLGYGPEGVVRRQVTDAAALLLRAATPEHLGAMSEEERDRLAALALDTDRGTLKEIAEIVGNHVGNTLRREALRERIWQLQADLTARMADKVAQELERETAAPSATRKTYDADQRHLAAFCAPLGVPALPDGPEALAAYILDGGLKPDALRRRLAGIADAHRRAGHILPTKHPLVRAARRHADETAAARQAAKLVVKPIVPIIAEPQEDTGND